MSNIVRYEQPTYSEIQNMAKNVVGSKFFGVKTEQEALTLMLLAQAEGMHPIQAMRQFHVIQGRPAMRADAMLAKFQEANGKVRWGERSDAKVEATFSHPSSGDTTVVWTFEMAKKAGLTGNPTWQKFPRQMLSARVISEGVRMALPSVVVGIYTPEEVEDFEPQPQSAKVPAPQANIVEVLEAQPQHAAPATDWRETPENADQLGDIYSYVADRFAGADEQKLSAWFQGLTAIPKFEEAWKKDSADAATKFLKALNEGKYDKHIEEATGFKLEGAVA